MYKITKLTFCYQGRPPQRLQDPGRLSSRSPYQLRAHGPQPLGRTEQIRSEQIH